MVVLFGLDVIPLGAISAILVLLQATIVGYWCFLCLVTAAISVLLRMAAAGSAGRAERVDRGHAPRALRDHPESDRRATAAMAPITFRSRERLVIARSVPGCRAKFVSGSSGRSDANAWRVQNITRSFRCLPLARRAAPTAAARSRSTPAIEAAVSSSLWPTSAFMPMRRTPNSSTLLNLQEKRHHARSARGLSVEVAGVR
jgi:hypothetical protein